MSLMIPLAMFGWPLVAIALFLVLNPRDAVIASYIGAWLFLPIAVYQIPGIPDYTKMSAATLGALVGTFLFDAPRLIRFRPHWIDVPIILYCLWSATSSFTTGKGTWDAASAIVEQTIDWGLPCFFGRVYFTDLKSFAELAIGIVIGGLIYVPLCLLEIRLSPQLHNWVYGYYQHSFAQTIRYGGFRPTVFMEHGLAVAMWMIIAALLAIWLRSTGALRILAGIRFDYLVGLLLITCILCKSTGALSLMLLGILALFMARGLQHSLPLMLMIAIAPAWMTGRTFDWFNGSAIFHFYEGISPERAQSFQVRLEQEDNLLKIAKQRPFCGINRWDMTPADQLWLLLFQRFGAVGLAAFTAVFLVPAIVLLVKIPFSQLCRPEWSSLSGLVMVVVLYTLDNLANGMTNPIFAMTAGALGSACVADLSYERNSSRAEDTASTTSKAVRRALWPRTAV